MWTYFLAGETLEFANLFLYRLHGICYRHVNKNPDWRGHVDFYVVGFFFLTLIYQKMSTKIEVTSQLDMLQSECMINVYEREKGTDTDTERLVGFVILVVYKEEAPELGWGNQLIQVRDEQSLSKFKKQILATELKHFIALGTVLYRNVLKHVIFTWRSRKCYTKGQQQVVRWEVWCKNEY